MRVLIVDDEASIRKVCMLVLKRFATVVTVPSSAEAIAALEQHPFDVVLVDLHLEMSMSGEALLRVVANRWPDARRVAFTASPSALKDRGLVDVVLEKPFSNELLIKTVRGF